MLKIVGIVLEGSRAESERGGGEVWECSVENGYCMCNICAES